MLNTIGKQFAHPNGICGRLATKVMNLMIHKIHYLTEVINDILVSNSPSRDERQGKRLS